jgi:hypothetical protein
MQEFNRFYKKLDEFRTSKNIKPWKTFGVKTEVAMTRPKDDQTKGQPTTAQQPQKTQPQQAGLLTQTEYTALVAVTFDQLGELLAAIENYQQSERFYGVTSIRIPNMKAALETGELEAEVEINLVAFSYPGQTPFDPNVIAQLLTDEKGKAFEPGKEETDKVDKIKTKWQREPFIWKPQNRKNHPPFTPFDK